MGVEWDELRLIWPAQLFAAEAQALIDAGCDDRSDVGFLLDEAFHDHRAFRLWNELDISSPRINWNDLPFGSPDGYQLSEDSRLRKTEALLLELVHNAETIPHYQPPRYYSHRANPPQPTLLTSSELRTAWAGTIADMAENGYFEVTFGSTCVDSNGDPDGNGQHRLESLLQTGKPLWPLRRQGQPTLYEQGWSTEEFYDMVEALHDCVARPRTRHYHEYGDEWDYSDYARKPGQAIYRWRTNELFERSELLLRIADEGEDMGQLVSTTRDPRDNLVGSVMVNASNADQDEMSHAIRLFRARNATRNDKRSAILALVRVLESRRRLLKQTLLTKDSAALFDIANRFDLRHRKADQLTDYDDAYLDWIFWWYLSTLELIESLTRKQRSSDER